jgi:hypothetical protein
MDYVKIMELKNGEIDGMMIIKEAKGRTMDGDASGCVPHCGVADWRMAQ